MDNNILELTTNFIEINKTIHIIIVSLCILDNFILEILTNAIIINKTIHKIDLYLQLRC